MQQNSFQWMDVEKDEQCNLYWKEWWNSDGSGSWFRRNIINISVTDFTGSRDVIPGVLQDVSQQQQSRGPQFALCIVLHRVNIWLFFSSSERAGPSHSSLLTPCSVLAAWRGRREGEGVGTGAWVEGVEGRGGGGGVWSPADPELMLPICASENTTICLRFQRSDSIRVKPSHLAVKHTAAWWRAGIRRCSDAVVACVLVCLAE